MNPTVESRIAVYSAADARLRELLGQLDPARVADPSLLPGWSIGHVLSHLARNADGLRNLLLWARSGVEVPMYRSSEGRDADAEAGASRPGALVVSDVLHTAAALAVEVDAMPARAWSAQVRTRSGGPIPAAVVLDHRIAELNLHRHDLGIDAGLATLDPQQGAELLSVLVRTYVRTHEVPPLLLQPDDADPIRLGADQGAGTDAPVVSGPAVVLAGWLSGRTDGSELRCTGPLPQLPNW